MVPQFSYCSTLLHHDIMPAMPINWMADILPRSDDPEWEQKDDDRLQWRGSNTGIWHDVGTRWRDAQRARLVEWATKDYERNVSVLMPTRDGVRVGGGVDMMKRRLGPAMLDVFFAGRPLSCASETCDLLGELFEYRKPHNLKEAGRYKYILDVSLFSSRPCDFGADIMRCRWMEMAGQVDSNDSLPPTRLSSSRQYIPNGVYIYSLSFYRVYSR
jgi:hypothetical protein